LTLCLLVAANALAEDTPPPHFKSILADFTIQRDGSIRMTEKVVVEAQPNQVIERTYWNDFEQHVQVTRITRPDGSSVAFENPKPPSVRWRGEPENDTFIIESNVEGAVIPAWSIPRAAELTHDESHMVRDPRDRLREILPIWRDAAKNPRSRYLLDF